jgi:hypothetical protein
MASLSAGAVTHDTSDATTYTNVNVAVPAGGADRIIPICVGGRSTTGTGRTITSVSVDSDGGGAPEAAVEVGQATESDGAASCCAGGWIILASQLTDPNASNLDVTVVFSGSMARMSGQAWASTDISATPHASITDVHDIAGAATGTLELDLNTVDNGCGLMFGFTSATSGTGSAAATGMTNEDADAQVGAEAARMASYHENAWSAATPRNLQIDFTGGAFFSPVGIAISFAPAAAGGAPEPRSRRMLGDTNTMTGGMQMKRRRSGLLMPERRLLVPGWKLPKRPSMRLEMC